MREKWQKMLKELQLVCGFFFVASVVLTRDPWVIVTSFLLTWLITLGVEMFKDDE